MADDERKPSVEITEVKQDSPERVIDAKATLTKFLSSHKLLDNEKLEKELAKIELPKIELPKLEMPAGAVSRTYTTSSSSSQSSVRREFRLMRISSDPLGGGDATFTDFENLGTTSTSDPGSTSTLSAMMRRLQSIDETKEVSTSPQQTKVITLRNRVQMQHVRHVQETRTKM